jgi:pimeloyl-ACP methyl ester carboxylesterase
MNDGEILRPDARIGFLDTGGTGPALLFAHGLGGTILSWWQQIPYFQRRFRCIAFAHRGFAPSRVTGDAPDPADFAGDIAALLDHLRVERTAIVAQSMGGWGALEFALADKARVSALVLAATSGRIDPKTAAPAAVARWQDWAAGERQRLNAAGIHPAAGAAMAAERPDLKFLYSALNEMSRGLDKEALRLRLMAGRTRPASDAAGVACPVLVACGARDPVFPSPAGPALAAAFPDGRHIEFANAGHSAYFERADEFNRAIEAFLNP